MRLIDADAQIEQWEADESEMEDIIGKMFTHSAINDLKHAPTVDAIPIDFVERWKQEVDTDAYNRKSVDWLVRDWRKENETD